MSVGQRARLSRPKRAGLQSRDAEHGREDHEHV